MPRTLRRHVRVLHRGGGIVETNPLEWRRSVTCRHAAGTASSTRFKVICCNTLWELICVESSPPSGVVPRLGFGYRAAVARFHLRSSHRRSGTSTVSFPWTTGAGAMDAEHHGRARRRKRVSRRRRSASLRGIVYRRRQRHRQVNPTGGTNTTADRLELCRSTSLNTGSSAWPFAVPSRYEVLSQSLVSAIRS